MRLPVIKEGLAAVKRTVLCRETLWALVLVVLLLSIAVMTADNTPTWIYQGF
jgi:hypothetical protein